LLKQRAEVGKSGRDEAVARGGNTAEARPRRLMRMTSPSWVRLYSRGSSGCDERYRNTVPTMASERSERLMTKKEGTFTD
jgi:hypothetical protein